MKLFVLSGMALAAALTVPSALAQPFHQTAVEHRVLPVSASYSLDSQTSTREVAPIPANRAGQSACRWKANVVVNRAVHTADKTAVAALAKPIHQFAPLSGYEIGTCQAAEKRIAAAVARESGRLASDATAVAQRDQGALMAELDGVAALSQAKGG
ncbi:MAG TPA: hypothetical protein VF509_15350 [Sphingobium sp.]